MTRTKQTSRRPVSDVRRAIIVKSATFTTKRPKAPKHKTVPMKAPTLQASGEAPTLQASEEAPTLQASEEAPTLQASEEAPTLQAIVAAMASSAGRSCVDTTSHALSDATVARCARVHHSLNCMWETMDEDQADGAPIRPSIVHAMLSGDVAAIMAVALDELDKEAGNGEARHASPGSGSVYRGVTLPTRGGAVSSTVGRTHPPVALSKCSSIGKSCSKSRSVKGHVTPKGVYDKTSIYPLEH
ncbi:hypothetical protein T484DRAFT_1859106 [Baffinella frigidus]|nr:hypothetical protein T484DRAFT_1859106 [Cryptophyta sp. CCMP2293]